MSNDNWNAPQDPANQPPDSGESQNQGSNPISENPQVNPYPSAQPENPYEQPDYQANPYGQSSQDEAPQTPFNPTSAYEQPSPQPENPYGQPGDQANPYGQPSPQPENPYGQPSNQANPYGQPSPQPENPYGQPSNQANPYGQSSQNEAPRTPFDPASAYGQPDPYAQPNGTYASQQDASYGQPYGYDPNAGIQYPTQQPGPYSNFGSGLPLADWPKRALGGLIDYAAPILVARIIPSAFSNSDSGLRIIGTLVSLALIAFMIYNNGYLGGTTGQSFGRKIAHTRLIDANTGQVIGFGKSVVRWIAHLIDSIICFVGWLFPLWDQKRQTLADKICNTVVVVDDASSQTYQY